MDKKRIYIIVALLVMIMSCIGGTMAYLQWETAMNQRSNIVFSVDEEYVCAVYGGGNITSNDVVLAPSTCTNSKYAIKRTVKVMPTVYNEQLGVVMDLWLDIKSLGSGLSSSQNFKYALTTASNSCSTGVVSSGNFNGKSANGKVTLLNSKFYPSTTTDTYYLYIWLDEAETSASTMNQSFSLSFNGSCTNEHVD